VVALAIIFRIPPETARRPQTAINEAIEYEYILVSNVLQFFAACHGILFENEPQTCHDFRFSGEANAAIWIGTEAEKANGQSYVFQTKNKTMHQLRHMSQYHSDD